VKADGFIEVTYAIDSHMISFDHIYVTGKREVSLADMPTQSVEWM